MIDTPNYSMKQQYQEMLDAIQEPKAQRQMDSQQTLSEIEAPPCKSCKRTLDMNPGEYACFRFAKTAFQGNPHNILFLLQANEKWPEANFSPRKTIISLLNVIRYYFSVTGSDIWSHKKTLKYNHISPIYVFEWGCKLCI